tara:strand:+ start:11881 stop:13185 length:1305 start_codon:yes stop_codon:yes gene_type:complete
VTTFNANNKNNSSKDLFDQKIKFNTEAYESAGNAKGIVEFNFFEKIRYGHVNTKNVPVIPREEYMQPIIYSNEISGIIFDFCVFGVEMILKHFQNCLRYGIIEQDAITKIAPLKAYVSPMIAYREGLKLNFEDFNRNLITSGLHNKITGLSSYVKEYMKFYKINHDVLRPMTLSKHCISKFASPMETGLAIQFYPTMFDDDQAKYDDIISSPNFKKYVSACRNFGFSVMKNTPNLIMFDINSAANAIPLSENGISSAEDLFESRYSIDTSKTINLLKQEMGKGYNAHANANRITLKVKDCNDRLIYNKKVLPVVNNINNNIYINNNIINIYITFKYHEEHDRMSVGKFNQIQQNVKYFQKRFDNESVIGYINDEFQSLYESEPNNYASFIRRENQKESEKLEDETQAQLSATTIEIEGPTIDRSPTQPTGRGTY